MLWLTFRPVLVVSAIVPALVLLVKVYQYDKIEKEPPGLIVSLMFYGILATLGAIITERIGAAVLGLFLVENSVTYNLLMYFIVVAISEEGFKYLLLKYRTWNAPDFNYQFDGIVYAVAVSLGFALWENIKYVALFGFSAALVRAVTAIPGHACFGVFMGTWYGLAKKYENNNQQVRMNFCLKMSILIPVLIHGSYDFITTLESDRYGIIFVGFILVMFLATWKLLKRMSLKDTHISET